MLPLVTNARDNTTDTQGSQIFQPIPTEFPCHLEETANLQLAAVDHLLPWVIAVSLQPSWQCVFSVFSAAAEVCLCTRQEQTLGPPLVGETRRHPAFEL